MLDYLSLSRDNWNLFLPTFSHIHPLHLFSNMALLLASLIPAVFEAGPEVALSLYLFSGVTSHLFTRLVGEWIPYKHGIGASGAVFGMVAFSSAVPITSRDTKGYFWVLPLVYGSLVVEVLDQLFHLELFTFLGLEPETYKSGLYCHMGGIITGLLAGAGKCLAERCHNKADSDTSQDPSIA